MQYPKERTKTAQGVNESGKVGWVNKEPEPIRVCECGVKYLKTRRGQTACLFCFREVLVKKKEAQEKEKKSPTKLATIRHNRRWAKTA